MATNETRGSKADSPQRRTFRFLVLLTTGVALVGGSLGYMRYFASYRFWFPLPVGAGPAGPAVPREPFSAAWTRQPVVLLGLGDSVTAGFGANPGLSYFERLVENPSEEFDDMRGLCLRAVIPNLTAVNLAVSGSNSIQHLEEQVDRLHAYPSDTLGIVVITTGGNDLIHWYGRTPPHEGAMFGASLETARPWIEQYRKRLETMIAEVTKAFPGGVHIFLANIYDPSDGVGDPPAAGLPPWLDMLAVHGGYNAVIEETARRYENVHLVDLRSAFLGHGVHCTQWWRTVYRPEDPHYWYSDNLEDPNNRGYDAIRRLFLNEMAQVLPEQYRAET